MRRRPIRPRFIDAPEAAVRLAMVTSGAGASTGFAMGEEVVAGLFNTGTSTSMSLKSHFDLVIFDWAGTMVDFGCEAPVTALIEAFRREGVALDAAGRAARHGHRKNRSRA